MDGRSRAALLDALRSELGNRATVRDSRAGLHVHATLPGIAHRDWRTLSTTARDHEVGIYSAGHCYLEPPNRAELVLGFTRLTERVRKSTVNEAAAGSATMSASTMSSQCLIIF